MPTRPQPDSNLSHTPIPPLAGKLTALMSSSPSPATPPPPETPPPLAAPDPQAALTTSGHQNLVNGGQQMFPMAYPVHVPGLVSMQNPEENGNGAGLYAVPYHPFMGTMTGPFPSTLIPLRYNIPTTSSTGGVGEEQGQDARQPQGPQRQVVVRRFQFAIQLDLSLILKLAAAVFLFNQDGSRQRLFLLVFFASLIYLYQTGVLSPLVRWIKRGAAPPQQRPAVPPENAPLIGDENEPRPEDNAGVEAQNQNVNQPAGAGLPAVNEDQQEPERRNGVNWLGIAREIQTIVVGFISSLLPGFHHND